MKFHKTKLEEAIESLPEAERRATLASLWREFRESRYFDFVAYVLKSLEESAYSRLLQPGSQDSDSDLWLLRAVAQVRAYFSGFDGTTKTDWSDEVEYD